jgi:hypothetical protein
MTREGQGIGPDDTPSAPTRTQWDRAVSGPEPELLAPFVPGRRAPSAPDAGLAGAEADTLREEAPELETPPVAQEPEFQDEPGVARPEEPWADALVSDPWSDAQPEPDQEPEAPWASPGEGGGAEVDLAELESVLEPEPEPELAAEAEPWIGADVESEFGAEAGEGEAAALADALEGLASRLRTEGAAGVEAAATSSDRITAVLAGFIAGYLAGREG